jgi:hypothetical protein
MNPQINRKEADKSFDEYVKMNRTHERLSSKQNFTTSYKRKLDPNIVSIAGDYSENPLEATKLLQSTSASALTVPCRAHDFRSEVTFRLSLRSWND